jgi:hypothetical protein
MLIGELFERRVTRAIPPVVFFHEQDPPKLEQEVSEYIITGGYPAGDPRATEGGIHEQFVRILRALRRELDSKVQSGLPASWISGFYGSGKSSFAKLLGLALDGRQLPGGVPLSKAVLAQDHSPQRAELERAWEALVDGLKPVGVVFDVGSEARDSEHIHSVVVRQAERRFGYCSTSHLVAEYELKLELEGSYPALLEKVREAHGKPWSELKDNRRADDYFSAALNRLQPDVFRDPLSWVDSRVGSAYRDRGSVNDAVRALSDMLQQRCPGRTLFIVIDEVSQYVHDNEDRMLALQSFVSSLGQQMKGQAWLLATGQQRLEETAGSSATLSKLKDRFPQALRVHLGTANIRDVVHRRLFRKKKGAEPQLRELFETHGAALRLYAYRGDELTATDFAEVYPLLPGYIDLLLRITSGLRLRSTRGQGDAYAIRGLLQLLGDLFRDHNFEQLGLGALVTLDLVYDVLHTALDADVQSTLTRAFDFAGRQKSVLMTRVVKAVALLELVQDQEKTSAELVARCLYAQVGAPNPQAEVQQALDALVAQSLLSLSEKTGYKLQSSAGQEWQRERDAYAPGTEQVNEHVLEALRWLIADVDKVRVEALELPWRALFSDGLGHKEARVKDERKHTVVTVDLQFTDRASSDAWIVRSDSASHRDRIVWVVGDREGPREEARQLIRSERMIERHGNRSFAPGDEKQRLLADERGRQEGAKTRLAEAVKRAFMAGELYFRGRQESARETGPSFGAALTAFGNRVLTQLYPHIITYGISDRDILFLIENQDLSAPPPVLCQGRLGLLKLDADRYEVTTEATVPRELLDFITRNPGVTGSTVLEHFGSPPHGVPPDVLKATVVGLLRGRRVRIELDSNELTSASDEGARELLKETGLRKARLFLNTTEVLQPKDRNAICKVFRDAFGADVAHNDEAIANEAVRRFADVRDRLTTLGERFRRLPTAIKYPKALADLEKALEAARRSRRVEPTVAALKRDLPVLREGFALLRRMETDLGDAALETLNAVNAVLQYQWPQLLPLAPPAALHEAARALTEHLASERPWEGIAELEDEIQALRDHYRERRHAILQEHVARAEAAVDWVKRREGFERLDPDAHYDVISPLREHATLGTDAKAIQPELGVLDNLFQARLDKAQAKAVGLLDELLAKLGEKPTVEVALQLGGRLIATPAELERLLEDIRRQIVHQLEANHRVRLR